MNKKTKISKHVIADYKKLVNEISELNGIIYHHSSIAEVYIQKNSLRDKKNNTDFFLGSRFYYRSPYTGQLIDGNIYTVGIKDYSIKTKAIERKVVNYFIALAYEAFEKFLRSITTRIVINNKKIATAADERLGFSSYKSCYLYLQSQYRDNTKILSLLRNMNDELDSSFKREIGLKNFINFYRVFSFCRNHIVHSNSFVELNAFKKHMAVDEKFARRYFGVYPNKSGAKFIIDCTETYKEALKTIVSFAYFIIKSFDSSFIK